VVLRDIEGFAYRGGRGNVGLVRNDGAVPDQHRTRKATAVGERTARRKR